MENKYFYTELFLTKISPKMWVSSIKMMPIFGNPISYEKESPDPTNLIKFIDHKIEEFNALHISEYLINHKKIPSTWRAHLKLD